MAKTKKSKMSYILFDEDGFTILGSYSTPSLAQDAREQRERELEKKLGRDVPKDSLYIAWVPMDQEPDIHADTGGM